MNREKQLVQEFVNMLAGALSSRVPPSPYPQNLSSSSAPSPYPQNLSSAAYPRSTNVGPPRIMTLSQLNSPPQPMVTSRNPSKKAESGQALGRQLGRAVDPSVVQFVERPLSRFNLPDGIRHYPGIAPKNLYNSLLTLPFQQINWKGTPLHRLACRISSTELSQYPILFDTIQRTLCSQPGLNSLAFSSIWINHYRDGSDYTRYHQDSYGSYVCMISIGQTRRLLTKDLRTKARATGIDCADGDVVIFSPSWDNDHQHSVPATKKPGSRISIVLFAQ